MAGALGCEVKVSGHREDSLLFGESQGRIVVSLKADHEEELVHCAKLLGVPFFAIGTVKGNEVKINNHNFGSLEILNNLHKNGLTRYFKKS
jgi:phosphoribosylformylglycinamidine synthase